MPELKFAAAKQDANVTQMQEQIEALTATVKEQSAQFQKVTAQFQVSKLTPQTVANNQ